MKSIIKTIIIPYFARYQQMVGISINEDDVIFRLHTDAINESHGFTEPNRINNKYVLSFNEKIFEAPQEAYQAVMIHEFTHLLDKTALLPELSESERHIIISEYTEYHATVAMYTAVAPLINNGITQIYSLELSEWIPINEYYGKMQKAYLDKMIDLNSQLQMESLMGKMHLSNEIIRTLMYYFGIEYVKVNTLSASYTLRLITQEFKINIKYLYEMLSEKSIIDKSAFTKIHSEASRIANSLIC